MSTTTQKGSILILFLSMWNCLDKNWDLCECRKSRPYFLSQFCLKVSKPSKVIADVSLNFTSSAQSTENGSRTNSESPDPNTKSIRVKWCNLIPNLVWLSYLSSANNHIDLYVPFPISNTIFFFLLFWDFQLYGLSSLWQTRAPNHWLWFRFCSIIKWMNKQQIFRHIP